MKKLICIAFVSFIFFLLIVSSSTAQVSGLQEMTMVIPAQSLAKVIQPLLPYKIDLGKNFLGSFFVQSIENIRIKKDKIFFTSLITGKDIKYATKIGKQVVNFVVGDVNLPSKWEVSFKFDKTIKKLLVNPYLQDSKNEKEFSQGDALLNTLLTALSGIEYPIELNNLKPVKSEFYNQLWILNMDIADVYAADGKLFVEMIPSVQIDSSKEE
ncbi:MAG: hypothetical protein KJP23_08160 [Deltaproteobacteria bacterium]|nr:hypothetical protein [Deltaproteobacteria bacterium]